jgi:hypothetical protein
MTRMAWPDRWAELSLRDKIEAACFPLLFVVGLVFLSGLS